MNGNDSSAKSYGSRPPDKIPNGTPRNSEMMKDIFRDNSPEPEEETNYNYASNNGPLDDDDEGYNIFQDNDDDLVEDYIREEIVEEDEDDDKPSRQYMNSQITKSQQKRRPSNASLSSKKTSAKSMAPTTNSSKVKKSRPLTQSSILSSAGADSSYKLPEINDNYSVSARNASESPERRKSIKSKKGGFRSSDSELSKPKSKGFVSSSPMKEDRRTQSEQTLSSTTEVPKKTKRKKRQPLTLKEEEPPIKEIAKKKESAYDRMKNYSQDSGYFGKRRKARKIVRVRPSEYSKDGSEATEEDKKKPSYTTSGGMAVRSRYSKFRSWRTIKKIQEEKRQKEEKITATLTDEIKDIIDSIDYLSSKEIQEAQENIDKKINNDRYLFSLCLHDREVLQMLCYIYASFGTKMSIQTRTQTITWFLLERLRRFWIFTNLPLPTWQEILTDVETTEFLKGVTKLCYHAMNTDSLSLIAHMEHDRVKHKIFLNFRQYDVRIVKKRLDHFGITMSNDRRGPFDYDDYGGGGGGSGGTEINFIDTPIIEYLASIHTHISEENMDDFSKNKLIDGLPFMCGLSSLETRLESQRIVSELLHAISGIPPKRTPHFYLKCLDKLWIETQIVFLNCVYEARLKKIDLYPPPNDKTIVLGLTKLHIHDLAPLSWYLTHVDPEVVQLDAVLLQNCGLNDECLEMLGKGIFQKSKKLVMTGNNFTVSGIHKCLKTWKSQDKQLLQSLDMSDCNLEDDCLIKLSPLFPHLEELYLNDNFLTWYGLRKITQTRKKTRRLKKIEMSRCNINDHAFYELMPLILKTETVILDGNELYPLELRIFARQVKECENLRLKNFVLANSNLQDDCLAEMAKFMTRIRNIDLRNNHFTYEGLKCLARTIRKKGIGELRALNLRGCGLLNDDLEKSANMLVKLESLNITANNFSGKTGVEAFCDALNDPDNDVNLKYVDFRHCRLADSSRKLVQETCRRKKIEFKVY